VDVFIGIGFGAGVVFKHSVLRT